MEKHGIYREGVGSALGEGGAGLVGDTGGEEGAVNAGMLPTDNTKVPWGKSPGPKAHCRPYGR